MNASHVGRASTRPAHAFRCALRNFRSLPKTLNPQMLMKGRTDEILSLVAHWTTKRPEARDRSQFLTPSGSNPRDGKGHISHDFCSRSPRMPTGTSRRRANLTSRPTRVCLSRSRERSSYCTKRSTLLQHREHSAPTESDAGHSRGVYGLKDSRLPTSRRGRTLDSCEGQLDHRFRSLADNEWRHDRRGPNP